MGADRRHDGLEPPSLGQVLVHESSPSKSEQPPSADSSKGKESLSPIPQTQQQQDGADGGGGRKTHLPSSLVRESGSTRGRRGGEQEEIQEELKNLLSKSPLTELLIPITDLMVSLSEETHKRILSLSSFVALIDRDMHKIKDSVWRVNSSLPDVVSKNHLEFLSLYQTYEKNQKTLLSELSDIKNDSEKKKKNVVSDMVDMNSDLKTCMLRIDSLTEKILPVSFTEIERRMRKCSFLTEEISEKCTKNCETVRKYIEEFSKYLDQTDVMIDMNEKIEKKI